MTSVPENGLAPSLFYQKHGLPFRPKTPSSTQRPVDQYQERKPGWTHPFPGSSPKPLTAVSPNSNSEASASRESPWKTWRKVPEGEEKNEEVEERENQVRRLETLKELEVDLEGLSLRWCPEARMTFKTSFAKMRKTTYEANLGGVRRKLESTFQDEKAEKSKEESSKEKVWCSTHFTYDNCLCSPIPPFLPSLVSKILTACKVTSPDSTELCEVVQENRTVKASTVNVPEPDQKAADSFETALKEVVLKACKVPEWRQGLDHKKKARQLRDQRQLEEAMGTCAGFPTAAVSKRSESKAPRSVI